MGGGGSSSGPSRVDPGYSSDEVDQFAKSTQGAGFGARTQQLKGAYALTDGGGYWGGSDNTNITDVANAFNAWKISQQNLKEGFNSYAALARAQEGRDATILGGAAANPSVIPGTENPNPLAAPVLGSVAANVSRRKT